MVPGEWFLTTQAILVSLRIDILIPWFSLYTSYLLNQIFPLAWLSFEKRLNYYTLFQIFNSMSTWVLMTRREYNVSCFAGFEEFQILTYGSGFVLALTLSQIPGTDSKFFFSFLQICMFKYFFCLLQFLFCRTTMSMYDCVF